MLAGKFASRDVWKTWRAIFIPSMHTTTPPKTYQDYLRDLNALLDDPASTNDQIDAAAKAATGKLLADQIDAQILREILTGNPNADER